MKLGRIGLLAFCLLGFAPAALVYAQEPPPDPNAISDSLTVFDPTGAIFAAVSLTEGEEEAQLAAQGFVLKWIPIAGLVDVSKFGFPIVLTEGVDAQGQPIISDVFGVVNPDPQHQTDLFLGFTSDTELPVNPAILGVGVTPTYVDEGNGIFDATQFLAPALVADGFTAEFRSDPVPEPSTAMLLSTGILALVAARRRR